MSITTFMKGLLVVACLIVAGCSSDAPQTELAVDDTVAPPIDTIPTTETPATEDSTAAVEPPTEDEKADDEGASADLPADASPLVDVALSSEPVVGGWPLPAGTYTSSFFREPVLFTTDRDLLLVDHRRGMVELVDPEEPDAVITIIQAASANTADAVVPFDATWLEDFANGDGGPIVDEGETATAKWWRATIDRPAEPLELCGGDCTTFLAADEGWVVTIEVEVPLVLAVPNDGETGFAVVVQPASDGSSALAESLAGSLVSLPADADLDESSMVTTLGTLERGEPIPAGRYQQHRRSHLIEIDSPTDLDARPANIGPVTFNLLWGEFEGSIGFTTPETLIDPDTPQPQTADEDEASLQLWTESAVSEVPLDTEAMDAWARAVVEVVDQGTTTIGGLDATWWDITAGTSVDHIPCDVVECPPGEDVCVLLVLTDFGFSPICSQQQSRLIFVDDADALIFIEAFPGNIAEIWDERIAPIIDTVTITKLA